MKTILLTAIIALAPSIALAQGGSSRGECDDPRYADPHRCGGASYGNPFYVPPAGGVYTGGVRYDGYAPPAVRRWR
jgi:hypothetical protein